MGRDLRKKKCVGYERENEIKQELGLGLEGGKKIITWEGGCAHKVWVITLQIYIINIHNR